MFWSSEDGYYVLTKAGYIALAVIAVIVLALIGFMKSRKGSEKTSSKFSVSTITFAGVSIALAFVLSFIKIYPMPWGGSVTLLSMFSPGLSRRTTVPKVGKPRSLSSCPNKVFCSKQ